MFVLQFLSAHMQWNFTVLYFELGILRDANIITFTTFYST